MPEAYENPKKHPDEAYDKQMIYQAFDERFYPVVQLIVTEVEGMQKKIETLETQLTDLIHLLHTHAMAVHTNNTTKKVMGEHGHKMTDLDNFYHKAYGKKLSEGLISKMVEDRIPEHQHEPYVNAFIDSARKHRDNIMGAMDQKAKGMDSTAIEPNQGEIDVAGGPVAKEVKIEEKVEKPKKVDEVEKLMNAFRNKNNANALRR